MYITSISAKKLLTPAIQQELEKFERQGYKIKRKSMTRKILSLAKKHPDTPVEQLVAGKIYSGD